MRKRQRSAAPIVVTCHTISDRTRLRLRERAYLLLRSAKAFLRARKKTFSPPGSSAAARFCGACALLPWAGAQSYVATRLADISGFNGAAARRHGETPAARR
jgi:hypothetical protein